jgi:hypothetical protein
MTIGSLDYLGAAVAGGEIPEPALGDVLLGLEAAGARQAAAMDGAGSLTQDLTPEAAAAVQAVLESLGKKRGKEDTRVNVHIPFAELVTMPGAEVLAEAWLRAKAGERGWLLGKDAEAAACDALIVPIVTAAPQWPVITKMIDLVLDAHGAADRPPVPLPPEAWQALRIGDAPGWQASACRTGVRGAGGVGHEASGARRWPGLVGAFGRARGDRAGAGPAGR